MKPASSMTPRGRDDVGRGRAGAQDARATASNAASAAACSSRYSGVGSAATANVRRSWPGWSHHDALISQVSASPASSAPRRRPLRRHGHLRRRHARRREVVDVRRAAAARRRRPRRARRARARRRPAARRRAARATARVGQLAADAQPFDLLGRLDEAQPRVRGVEGDDLARERGEPRVRRDGRAGRSARRAPPAAPRARSSSTAVAIPSGAAGRTSASVAIRCAFGTWL